MAGDQADVAGAAPLGPRDAGVVPVNGDVGEERLLLAQPELAGEQAVASGGVDHGAHQQSPLVPALAQAAQGGVVDGEVDARDAAPLVDFDPGFTRAIEQDLVELLPADLVGLRARDLFRAVEFDRTAGAAVVGRKLHAPLDRKAGGLDPLGEAELGEGIVGRRDQRLADVEAGKALPLEQHDPVPAGGERNGRRAARGPAASDGEIEVESGSVQLFGTAAREERGP